MPTKNARLTDVTATESNAHIDRPGFSLIAGTPSLDFVNSVRFRGRAEECETIVDYAALLDWTSEADTLSGSITHRLRREATVDPVAADRALRRAWQLRDILFSAFSAVVRNEQVSDIDIEALNKVICRAGRNRIVRAADDGYEWVWDAGRALDAPLWPIAESAGDILTSNRQFLVKQCDGEACLRIFLDSTKNRRRRWCDAAGCGNRHRVQQHYWRSQPQP